MSEIIIFHNPRCGKSRGALQILEEEGIEPQTRLYLQNPPTEKELRSLLKKLGIRAVELLRKNEALYKEKYKDKTFTEAQWIKILAKNPILIERPIVIHEDRAVIARPPEKALEIL